MDKWDQPILYWNCGYLSMLGLTLPHVESKCGDDWELMNVMVNYIVIASSIWWEKRGGCLYNSILYQANDPYEFSQISGHNRFRYTDREINLYRADLILENINIYIRVLSVLNIGLPWVVETLVLPRLVENLRRGPISPVYSILWLLMTRTPFY